MELNVNIILLFFGAAFFAAFVVFLILSLGYRKSSTQTVTGYLTVTKHEKNVYHGGKGGRWYKNFVSFVYTYRVDGKKYTASGNAPGKPDQLCRTRKIIYQKKHPGKAYIKDLTFPIYPVCCVMAFVVSLVFVIPAVIM